MAVRTLHQTTGRFAGRCKIARGQGWMVAVALRLGRFPSNAEDIPVSVEIKHLGGVWTWRRDFDGHVTESRITYDHSAACVREQLGCITLWLTVQPTEGGLSIHIRQLSVLGIRCPAFLLPRSATTEWQGETGQFCFDVSADMPGLGRLIRYRGWLKPVHETRHPD